ncbi:hypothetical protein SNE40_001546 [Patella caerulea]|uniref:Chitin-binding type-2 domain-containing protein n=1 Tax=Patella caerulea TaxID=87958 RepID=A0AAN8KG63_PATCE
MTLFLFTSLAGVVFLTCLIRTEATYRCTPTADRSSGNCQTYTLRCQDDFTLASFSFTRTCTGDKLFSELYKRCVDPATFNFICQADGGGSDDENDEGDGGGSDDSSNEGNSSSSSSSSSSEE